MTAPRLESHRWHEYQNSGGRNSLHCALPRSARLFPSVDGRGPTGFSDVAPAVKAQLGLLPGGVVFSATAGVGMPTGASGISGHGYNPSVQCPWSRETGGGWSLSGIFAQFWFAGQKSNAISEAALSWSGQSVPRRSVPSSTSAITRTTTRRANSSTPVDWHSASDFHAGFGLTRRSPSYFFGVGYSLRFDSLF